MGLFQQRGKPSEEAGVGLNGKAKEEVWRQYKRTQYRNLILMSALTFFLGVLIAFLLKL